MPVFTPGLDLSQQYYWYAVRPILDRNFPGLPHSAALIGYGSDVLGYDSQRSMDHMWGPRLVLFLAEENFELRRADVDAALRSHLPTTFRGYPTNFGAPDEMGVRLFAPLETGPVNHLVQIVTLRAYFSAELGVDPYQALSAADWLTLEEHRLLSVTAGRVFHDQLGLEALRHRLAYYPRDVWLYQMAAGWAKIGEEEPFVGRCGEAGDDLGSRLIAARLAQYLMRLCFLIERQYAPYSKWLGTAFARLACAPQMLPHLEGTVRANTWQEREAYLSRACETAAEMHNRLGITGPLPARVSPFHNRPYQVIRGEVFAAALREAVQDSAVRAIPGLYGSVNQWVDSVAVLSDPSQTRRLKGLYG